MIRVLAAGVIAMVVSIIVGPTFVEFLRRNEFGQHIREELPEAHRVKQGTPTMGGLLILVVATGAFLAVSKYKVPALTVLFVTLGCGAIGFLDDFIKLRHRRSLGLRGRWKLLLLAMITVASRRNTSSCPRASSSPSHTGTSSCPGVGTCCCSS
jgi:phospho-N-acetylmuramoyl-pentapeptide-transferase